MASSVDRLVSNVDTHQCKYLTNIYKGEAYMARSCTSIWLHWKLGETWRNKATTKNVFYSKLKMNGIGDQNDQHEYFWDSFFHPLLLSGISSKLIFQIRNWIVPLKNKSLNLPDRVIIVCSMCIILMELRYLQDCELG